MPRQRTKPKRNTSRLFNAYHRYFRSSGFYRFVLGAVAKLAVIIAVIAAVYIAVVEFTTLDLKALFFAFADRLHPATVWAVFALSESTLGLIPPDLFILWGFTFPRPLITLAALSVVSYLGGGGAYGIGKLLVRIPRVNNFMHTRHKPTTDFLRRWGGFFILIAATLPIPYSTVTMISGMTGYPLSRLMVFGLARIFRFFLYAAVIMGVV